MRSRILLSERWSELKRYWSDETSLEFERLYFGEMEETLSTVEKEFEKFQIFEAEQKNNVIAQ